MKLLCFIFFLSLFTEAFAMQSILSVTPKHYKIVKITEQMKLKMYREESEGMTYENYREFNRYDLWVDELQQTLTFQPVYLGHFYEYTRALSDANAMLSIKSFTSELNEFSINHSIPVISAIPTSEWGKAVYQLKLQLEDLEFVSFADRRKWAIRDYFKSYLEIYQAEVNGKEYYLLEVSEPNRFYDDNGSYFIAPISSDKTMH